jgi:hypothetical protein
MATEVSKQPNGKTQLPESQEIAIRQGLTAHHELVAERNALAREAFDLKASVAAHKVASEAQQSLNAELESRMATVRAERDQAVADMATFRAILISIQAQLRAFAIDNEPMVRIKVEGDGGEAQ